jgi:4-hydroxy-4-methyl-2-oxoglutarate aldolase
VRYRTPQDSVRRWRVSDWGQPVTIGGVRIALGDVVIADRDGIVIVPRRLAHEVAQRAKTLMGSENAVRQAIRRGLTPLAAYEKFGVF